MAKGFSRVTRRQRFRHVPSVPTKKPASQLLPFVMGFLVYVWSYIRCHLLMFIQPIERFSVALWRQRFSAITPAMNGSVPETVSSVGSDGNSSGNGKDHLPTPKRVLFPRENVQLGWKANGRKWLTGAGMINVGNTCYLNSTLQALFHVPAIANWLVSDGAHRERCDDSNGCIICAMAKTLLASQSNQGAIKPYLVYSKLRLVCKHLVPGRQEDAHEFLRYLMEAMEKSYLARSKNAKDLEQYSKETTPLNQILGGYLRSEVKCLSCQHISTTFQHFEDLLLDIRKASSIEEALGGYFARERLEEMQYKCESCKKRVAATKQFSLERAPFVLCIQLKRFSMLGGKINKHVELRRELDLTPYSSKSAASSGRLTYKLVSMVTHLGNTQHCGHYTAIGSTESGNYYVFDDSSVRPTSIQNVTSTNAYIIFYELESVQNGINKATASSTATLATYVNASGTHSHGKVGTSGPLGITQNGGTSFSSSSPLRVLGNSGNTSNKSENRPGFIGPLLPQQMSSDRTRKFTNELNGAAYRAMDEDEGELMISSTSRLSPVSSTTSSLSSPSPVKAGGFNTLTHSPSSSKTATKNSLTQISSNGSKSKFGTINGVSSSTNGSLKSSSTASPSCSSMLPSASASSSTLLSMPKLCNSPTATKSTVEEMSRTTEGTCSTGVATSTSSYSTGGTGSKIGTANGHTSNSKAISLVPYDADDDDDDDGDDDGGGGNIFGEKPLKRRNVGGSLKQEYDYNDDPEQSHSLIRRGPNGKKIPELLEEESSCSPKSPPVIKTKTGLWKVSDNTIQVCNNNNNSSSSSSSGSANSSKNASPSTSGSSSPSSYANHNHVNNGHGGGPLATGYQTNGYGSRQFNGYNGNYNRTSDVVNHLQKYSHRGYGAPVRSWNGQQTNMDRELQNERREELKRQRDDDLETEMDRGRTKKVKPHFYFHDQQQRDIQMPNPFQSYQDHQTNNGGGGGGGPNRNKWGGNQHNNGFGGGGKYSGGQLHFQNRNHKGYHHGYQNGNHSRNNNYQGFRNGGNGRHGFYNKSHHHHHHYQRDNGGGGGNGFRNR
ncbi:ubiquitin carboxyl-terminal hydrolase 36 isoform X2 [Malaya genurostris]|uniref:ubiquitin carboxyl-terminal hydrolase 36 isoform X2 n=1 Tax=Malaya genurostris TaxID=325434 RepID=UPI0026F3AEF1|nr:ubiquitin carboxyl-terminal hydrolase 36 isoform X2 [Malaya genurostris]